MIWRAGLNNIVPRTVLLNHSGFSEENHNPHDETAWGLLRSDLQVCA